MGNVVIVPGLHDSGALHWQTLWEQRLPNVVRVRQAQWHVPDLARWTDNVVDMLARTGPSWVVAHSFGCLASVSAVAHARQNILGLFLVAPADPNKFGIADVLPAGELDVPGLLVGSLSDPWLSWSRAQQWAKRWQLPIVCAGNAGHINADSGHGEWQEGWRHFERLRATVPQQLDLLNQLLPIAV